MAEVTECRVVGMQGGRQGSGGKGSRVQGDQNGRGGRGIIEWEEFEVQREKKYEVLV